jgi:hypothetical protein
MKVIKINRKIAVNIMEQLRNIPTNILIFENNELLNFKGEFECIELFDDIEVIKSECKIISSEIKI